MSLDTSSRPGQPGPEELVPSRYALQVGDIDVLVVSDGVLSLPGAMLAHNVDPGVRSAIGLLEAWLESQLAYRGWPGLSLGILHDQELIGARLELQVLEGIDVEGDRQRGEVGRDVIGVDHDPLDPTRPMGDDLASAQVAVADRLLEQGAEEVEHVRAA